MQITTEHLSPEAAQAFIQMLPDKIRLGLLTYAAQIEQRLSQLLKWRSRVSLTKTQSASPVAILSP
ncbi:hypothetical protein [Leptolyngbya sp. Cla-17]|uniref:hypothetical protein n=1 Tax=Leptolyngbya sp. Cla-17 TaxID=2803751 RepID=UPI001F5E2F5A|nr:hypothetical protein [Leptolyngbya sp. Cla-17]